MPFARCTPAWPYACLCLIALSLVLAGCGGKSATSSTTTAGTRTASQATSTPRTATTETPPAASASTKSFIGRTDAICREANVRLARSKITSKKPEAIAALVRQNQATEEKAVDQLARLKPPATLSSDWQKMLGYRRSLAQQLGVYASAVSLGVKSNRSLGASKKKLHAQLREVGSRAGFKDCAKIG